MHLVDCDLCDCIVYTRRIGMSGICVNVMRFKITEDASIVVGRAQFNNLFTNLYVKKTCINIRVKKTAVVIFLSILIHLLISNCVVLFV